MPMPNTLEVCRRDLFTNKEELDKRYDAITVSRIIRLRDLYMYKLTYPDSTDRKFVEEAMGRYGISQSAAYTDLGIVKQLLPLINSSSRDFHRWRFNEMAMETYKMAKQRKDTKTMAQITKHYGEMNKVYELDDNRIPYDEIVPQPFTATDDPTVLGIKPIPNIQERIKSMIAKYRAESIDIEDVEAEEIDLEESDLWLDGEAQKENIL